MLAGEGKEFDGGGVSADWLPGGILRMKFMGALGLASARVKRPAVAAGGNGGCGGLFVRRSGAC